MCYTPHSLDSIGLQPQNQEAEVAEVVELAVVDMVLVKLEVEELVFVIVVLP